MAAALVVAPAPEALVGQALAISGTGFAFTTGITIHVTSVEEDIDVTWTTTSDGAGAWALPGSITPQQPGLYTISATDGTSTKTAQVKVSV